MAQYITFQPSDYFNTKLYTGDDTSPKTITGVGFQPDITISTSQNVSMARFVWDAVRGGGADKEIPTNAASAEGGEDADAYGYLSAFAADGYTVTAGSINDNFVNDSSSNYVSWNWKAGTTSGITQGSATITPTSYSFNETAGFSIITYTGTGASASVPHGLGATPACIIVKQLDTSRNWAVYHKNMRLPNGPAADFGMHLNNTDSDTGVNYWDDIEPTSTLFYVGSGAETNQSTGNYVAYCWAEIPGFSSFGGYIGNGNADGTFVYTGFQPAFLITKTCNNSGQNWNLYDNKRPTYVGDVVYLEPNSTATEGTSANMEIDFLTNGFKPRGTNSGTNASGYNYVYLALGAFPLVSSNDVPCTAR